MKIIRAFNITQHCLLTYMKCIMWILEDQPPPSCVLDLIGHRHAHSQEGCDVCVWCVELRWETANGFRIKSKIDLSVKKISTLPCLSYWGGVTLISDHTHTHTQKSRLHWAFLIKACQKPILILNEQLDDGWWVGIASLLETFSHVCFPRISKIFHRSLKHFRLNKLAIICHGDNGLSLVFNSSTARSPTLDSFQAAKHFSAKCYCLPMQSLSLSVVLTRSISPRGPLNVIKYNSIHMTVIFCSGVIDREMI